MTPSNRRRSHRSSYVIENLEMRVMLSAGDLDTSFGGGKSTIDFGNGITVNASDVALQDDGKTVVVGHSSTGQFAVARFNVDGTPDTTFGAKRNGTVLTSVGDKSSYADAVAIDADGNIIAVGTATSGTIAVSEDFAVVRYLPDGTPDRTFDGDGKVIVDFGYFGGRIESHAYDVATSNGKIVVVGVDYHGILNSNDDFAVIRLNPNGSLDDSFDGDGKRTFGFGGQDTAQAVAIDSNNKIVIAGFLESSTSNRQVAIARLNDNGSFDKQFNSDGKVTGGLAGLSQANGILIQSGNSVVVVGRTGQKGAQADFLMERFTSGGALDPTFGGANLGLVVTDFGGNDQAQDVIRSFDGGIIVGGSTGSQFAIAKFTADGLPDTTFSTDGKVITSVTGGGANALASGPGRRFMAVSSGGGRFLTARYLDAGANVVYLTAFANPIATESALDDDHQDKASFFIFRSERLPTPTRVFVSASGSAASNRSVKLTRDYIDWNADPRKGGYIDIPANQTYVLIEITAVNDALIEGDEIALFTLKPHDGYEVGRPYQASITIRDDDSVTRNPTADAYVQDISAANTNFGTAKQLFARKNPKGNRAIYLKFDISNLDVTSAKLYLYGGLNNTLDPSALAYLYSVSDTTWSESQITFNNRPIGTAPALATATISGATPGWYAFDVTAYLQAQKLANKNEASFLLRSPLVGTSYVQFCSREGLQPPRLVVG